MTTGRKEHFFEFGPRKEPRLYFTNRQANAESAERARLAIARARRQRRNHKKGAQ